MRVETASGTTFRLTYGAEAGGEPGGRVRPVAAGSGAAGAGRGGGRRGPARLDGDGRSRPRRGRLAVAARMARTVIARRRSIVGADGLHSVVARDAGVARPARLDPRVGLTYHLPDPEPATSRDARMRVLRDGYVGIAPVAGRTGQHRDRAGSVVAAGARPRRRAGRGRRHRGGDPADRRRPGRVAARRADRRHRRRLAARASGHPARRSRLAAGRRRRRVPRPVHRRGDPPRAGLGRAGGRGDPRAPARRRGVRRLRARDAAPVPGQGRRVVARPGVPRQPVLFEYAARRVASSRRFVRRWAS